MNPPADYDWTPTAAPCHNCDPHQWHALECTDCACETSTQAQRLIIPRLRMPRTWHNDHALNKSGDNA